MEKLDDLDLDRWLAEWMGGTDIWGYVANTPYHFQEWHPPRDIAQAYRCEDHVEKLELEQEYSEALEQILEDHWGYSPSTFQIAHATPEQRCHAIRAAVEGGES